MASPGLINIEDRGEDEIVKMHDDFLEKPQAKDNGSHSIEDVAASTGMNEHPPDGIVRDGKCVQYSDREMRI